MSNSISFDVIIVGAGPSGLATAISLLQQAKQAGKTINLAILEKGASVGAHILSGAVFEPQALTNLIPNWQQLNAPLDTPVTRDELFWFSKKHQFPLPIPSNLKNKGNYIISLGKLCRWFAAQAEQLGAQIFAGFSAKEVLFDQNRVIGVKTGDLGLDQDHKPTTTFQPGINLYAKYLVVAEGCRGSLTQILIDKFNLHGNCPQTYGLGIKEMWQIEPQHHQPGLVTHSIGWPLPNDVYGGSWIYHFDKNLLSLGMVVALDYKNPFLNPFQELQQFKHHPFVARLLKNGKRIAFGARTVNEGGLQSIPQLTFPGGLLVGCSAGFLNVMKIKGIHNAIESGNIAGKTIFNALLKPTPPIKLHDFTSRIKKSTIVQELYIARNIRPAFKYGLFAGVIYAAIDTFILRGKAPWTFKNHSFDHIKTRKVNQCKKINYPKPDGILSFDIASSVYLANITHRHDQPNHLLLKTPTLAISCNLSKYASLESRFCPAGVYEIIYPEHKEPYLQINSQNCIHCKACDIKDPKQNISWQPPEGGSGPNYGDM